MLASIETLTIVIQLLMAYLIFVSTNTFRCRQKSRLYDGRAQQYEDNLHLTFLHIMSEVSNSYDKLNLSPSSRVLEISTGRDSTFPYGSMKVVNYTARYIHRYDTALLQQATTTVCRSFSVSNDTPSISE